MGTATCAFRSLLAVAAWASLAPAADLVSVTVQATDSRASFVVDGTTYRGAAHFSWVEGSKHTLEVRDLIQYIAGDGSALSFQKYADNKAAIVAVNSPIQPITAARDVTTYTIEFYLYHRVDLWINTEPQVNFFDASAQGRVPTVDPCAFGGAYVSPTGFIVTNQGVSCTRPAGTVPSPSLLAQFVPTSSWVWIQDGTTVQIDAYAYPGNVFLGWQMPSSPTPAYLQSVVVTAPMLMRAIIVPGRRYRFFTTPVAGLKLVIDRTQVPSRPANGYCRPTSTGSNPSALVYQPGELVSLCDGELDFAPGTQHVLAAPTSQMDSTSGLWVFDSWLLPDGRTGGQNTLWTAPEDWKTMDVTARFVKGIRASLLTEPTGLKLKVDGRDNWVSYNFDWGVGHKHSISAPAEQVDGRGRRYRFSGWSNGGPSDQEITVSDDGATPGALHLTARYELLGQLRVSSDPSSLSFVVNATACQTPCTVDAPAGTSIAVEAAPSFAYSSDTRVAFRGWADGGTTASRAYAFTGDVASLLARYNLMQKLTLITDPDGGATWQLEPAADAAGFFVAGTRVQATIKPNPGYKFRRFEGALSGPYESGTLSMTAPATIVARLEKTPALKENSVVNAASRSADPGVVPGSIVAIEGYNLAPAAQTGPASPLAQTLQSVIVQLGDRFLPLVSVAPEQIVAVLPSDLAEGDATLTVRSPGQPVVSTTIHVVRNAPGLFPLDAAPEDTPLALAYHEDGSAISPESPARAGETVTLLGTGLGPLDPRPLDGFAVPASPLYTLKDPLTLLIGGEERPAAWAGATAGRVGFQSVRFQVDAAMGQGLNAEIRVRASGAESNTVLLPLE